MNFCFMTFISLPTFKMPSAVTCPQGKPFASYPKVTENLPANPTDTLASPPEQRLECRAGVRDTGTRLCLSPCPPLPLVLKSQAATSVS